MEIRNRQPLSGVNRWFGDRAFAAVAAGMPQEAVSASVLQTLMAALDRLAIPAHQAGAGERLRRSVPPGAGWEKMLIELAAELQFLSGDFRGEGIAQRMPSSEIAQVALECQEFPLAESCLDAALRICVRLYEGQSLELEEIHDELAARADEACLGGSTGPIVAAARRRGIPAYRLDGESLVQLGEGVHQQRICTAMTSRTSQIAVQVSTDKHLVSRQWSRIGIPVAREREVRDEEEAVRTAHEVGWPVAVKPADADYGRGVSLHLRTAEQVRAAYPKARAGSASARVLVQRCLQGASHRLLVVDGRLAAAVRRDPIAILGDGRQSVRELVGQANREARWGVDRQVTLGEREQARLAEAGFVPESVPARGVRVPLSDDELEIYSNVTERVHPDTRELASDAARVIGLDVAGLDVIALDISRPLAEQGGGFLEINAQPAIAIHRTPHCDRPQAVGDAVAASLFPPPARGRIPLVIVLGGRQADEAARQTAEHLRHRGVHVAVSTPERTCWDQRALVPDSASLPDRLSTLMLHPRTEAAVLRATAAEVLRAGLGTDQCDVLVLAGDSPGEDEIAEEEWTELLARLTAASGHCIVSLGDPQWAECAAAFALGR